jgi:hypothetical protein
MALVRVTNVDVLNNPCFFLDPLQFEITFEAATALPFGKGPRKFSIRPSPS